MPHNPIRIVVILLVLLIGSAGAGARFDVPRPDEVFRLSASNGRNGNLHLDWSIAPDFYLYRDKMAVSAPTSGDRTLSIGTGPGKRKDDPSFGETEIYLDAARVTVPAAELAGAASPRTIQVTYQGCAEKLGICYPPVTKSVDLATLAVSNPEEKPAGGIALTETAAPSGRLADPGADAWMSGSLVSVLAAFLGFGLLLTFTPCVLPMIPILSGMLARDGQQLSAGRGFALSTAYVLAMAAAYGLLGVAAAWSGQNLQVALQTPWAIGAMGALFVALALSMFGLFELRLPSSWTTFVSGRTSTAGGSYSGAAVLGFTSALIVGPCVTPPLAGALLYVSQTGDTARGAAALFMLGLGMGLPLIGYGTVGARALPKSGLWLVRMKQAFGVVFLGIAIWMLARIVPAQATMALWALLAIGSGVFLGAFDAVSAGPIQRLAKTAGIAAVLYGGTLVVGTAGGAIDPLRPLVFLAQGSQPQPPTELTVTRVTTPEQFDAAVSTARAGGKPILVDFTAEWCVTCKEIESNVFRNPAVQPRLNDVAFIQVDVTDNTEASRTLMQRFGIMGPPTILFLDPGTGQEIAPTRTIGTIDADGFLWKLSAAGA